jgi:hypothetical protein
MRASLIDKCDKIFSIVIRSRYADELGYVKCATCPKKSHWTELTCGHWRKRRHLATRWDLRNAGPQCLECNTKDLDMEPYLINKFGLAATQEVYALSNTVFKISDWELRLKAKSLEKEL